MDHLESTPFLFSATSHPFCQTIDRGIALRKNLCLPQSQTASAIVHGLQAGEIYSFTVSCVAEVEGALRHVRKITDSGLVLVLTEVLLVSALGIGGRCSPELLRRRYPTRSILPSNQHPPTLAFVVLASWALLL